MKYPIKAWLAFVVLALGALIVPRVEAANILTAPQVLVCPGPLFPANCKDPVFASINSPLTVASGSKTNPAWAHTFSGYPKLETLLVTCPVNATLSADAKQCTNPVSGADASLLLSKAALLAATSALPAPPATADVVISWDGTPPMGVVFPKLPTNVMQCFVVSSGTRKSSACLLPVPQ